MEFKDDYVIEWDIDTTEDIFYLVAEYEAENKDISHLIKRYEEELNIEPVKQQWKSKYNTYVVYDYEPFNTPGFKHRLYYPNTEYSEFMKHLINNHLNNINVLETYHNMEGWHDDKHTKTSIKI
ncbi:MAG: hypothetical protein NC218_08520 [Acetobacter sp.]|nr:hypothetical protein [Acetobacter sp.]